MRYSMPWGRVAVLGEGVVQGVSFMAVADFPRRAARVPPNFIHVGGDFTGFGSAHAAQTPDDHDDLAHEHFLKGTLGRKIFVILTTQGFKFVGRFLKEITARDDLSREQPVLQ